MPAPDIAAAGVFLDSGSGTTAPVPVPAGMASGSVVSVHLYKESTSAITKPTGFNELVFSPLPNTSGPVTALHVFWKRATASDSGTYDFTWTGSTFRKARAFRWNSDILSTGTPFEILGSATSGGTASTTTPAVSGTTLGADRRVILTTSSYSTGTWGAPTGGSWREDHDEDDEIYVASKNFLTAGSTGSITITGPSAVHAATLIAAIPGAGAPPAATNPAFFLSYS